MTYSGAIFDVDGVLVDSPHEHAWREALRRLFAGPWRDRAPATRYAPEAFTTEVYLAQLAGKPRMAGAASALAFFGLPDPDGAYALQYAEAKQAMIVELIERRAFTAFADGARLLLRLKDAGLRLAAASSSKNANDFLVRVPVGPGTMLDLFDANLCGRDFPQGKPHPAIFLAAAAELGLPPERCFVVEDAVSGVQAARAGGMACVGVARLGDEEQLRAAGATLVVASLDQVRLEELAAQEGRRPAAP
ncbi:MAG TPA: HAD-IA family hydrolase [Chloroflexaceae bacterium]|nr:HAD-IA family hydrolase [Chloroflexaceae bacterium]